MTSPERGISCEMWTSREAMTCAQVVKCGQLVKCGQVVKCGPLVLHLKMFFLTLHVQSSCESQTFTAAAYDCQYDRENIRKFISHRNIELELIFFKARATLTTFPYSAALLTEQATLNTKQQAQRCALTTTPHSMPYPHDYPTFHALSTF